MKRFILSICLSLLTVVSLSAQEEEVLDSLRASLITCTPGTDIYAHFGHTALRIIDFTTQKDYVFNYGCFDASHGDFVLKFIKGETDYVVDAENGNYFFGRYDYMGNGVTEQVLDLTQAESNKLFDLLIENLKPENRGYRYNWLYDNCTTRARDMIERAIDGKVSYINTLPPLTARDELHECLANNSWLKLGIDLMLGTEIDTLAPRNIQQFIPAHYEADLSSAIVTSPDGTKRKLVLAEGTILEEKDANKVGDTWFTPVVAFSLLLIITIALCFYDYRRKKITYWFDVLLHTAQGLAGIIIAYLFFFSVHPAVSTNWQVIIFNPLFLLYAAYIIYCGIKNKKNQFVYVIPVVILAYIIVHHVMGQSINTAVHIMVLTLLIRNAVDIAIIEKQNK